MILNNRRVIRILTFITFTPKQSTKYQLNNKLTHLQSLFLLAQS